ncbi:MAG TPA: lytic transglycosylase domain-containing protein [Streptosporangiaceae bacterium]
MLFPDLRRAALRAAAVTAACVSMAGLAVQAAAAAIGSGTPSSHVSSVSVPAPQPPAQPSASAGAQRQEFVPDLIAAVPGGITPAQLAKIGKLSGVTAVLPVDGGKVTVNGHSANVLGVSPQAFRPWTPLSTAAAVWSDLARGQLISTDAAARKLHLTAGKSYQVSAAIVAQVPFGGATALSVPGADAIVNLTRAAQLGLAKNFAVLISAPQANLSTLKSQVQSVIGHGGQVVNLVSYSLVIASKLPVETNAPAGVPANWLDLFQKSAAQYCQGMSWTVLAAIAEIESGDGANDGPSSAGALGPMQFLPSTWAIWGIDGFGPAGSPDIMNPLDAVPSAARMLCADGGANPATLASAIFSYNHATWYVDEVLALASEYNRNNP